MEYVTQWHCTYTLSGGVDTASDCVATATTTPSSYFGGSSTTPLFVQDAGNVSFGLAIIIFLLGLMFSAFIFGFLRKV